MLQMSEATVEKPPQKGVRKSPRLQESGYYKNNGTPVISTKGTCNRVNKKRATRSDSCPRHGETEETGHDCVSSVAVETPRRSLCFQLKLLFNIIFLFLVFSTTCYVYLTDLNRENMAHSRSSYNMLLSTAADKMPNYALLSDGAKVTWSSDTYQPSGLGQREKVWIFLKQMTVLEAQSLLIPGRCWPFVGNRGYLHIKLTDSIHITNITLGHIHPIQSPTGAISSAPKDFSLYGMKTINGVQRFLGTFTYDQNGPSFQTFAVPQEGIDDVYHHVNIKFSTNWGDPEYTCLYNIRVHGTSPRV